MSIWMIAAMLAAATTAPAEDAPKDADPLAQATRLIKEGKPDAALPILDTALAAFAKQYAGEKGRLYCAGSPTETLFYMAAAAKEKTGAVAIKPDWCDALFLKAFALIDLDRLPESRAPLEQAVAMAPMNAHYLNELGYNYEKTREWSRALEFYDSAFSAAEMGEAGDRVREQGRARRGRGYVLVEQGKWAEAEAAYKQALKLDPNDAKAKGELGYIAEHRPR